MSSGFTEDKTIINYFQISFVEQEKWKKINRRTIIFPPHDTKWQQMWYLVS